jgi:polysaccharide export outer membrane protein
MHKGEVMVRTGLLSVILAVSVAGSLAQQVPSPPTEVPEPQSLQQQYDRLVAEAAAAQAAPYRIQPGDELDIRVYAISDLSATVRVRPDGRISLLLLDDVEAAGRTPQELSETLSQLYSSSYRDPRVTVIVRNFYNFQAYVGGAVAKPGLVSLSGGQTMVSAIFQAGGFVVEDGPKQVVLLRQQTTGERTAQRLDLDEVLLQGRPDIALQPSDILYVPKHGISVYVGGEVVEPGLVQLTGNLTALSAILKAKGLKPTAKANSVVLLRNSGQSIPQLTKLNVSAMLSNGTGDVVLQPFDVVFVPKSTIAKMDQFVDQYMRQLLPISVNFGFSYIVGGGSTFIE